VVNSSLDEAMWLIKKAQLLHNITIKNEPVNCAKLPEI